jgi:hypothetical protein
MSGIIWGAEHVTGDYVHFAAADDRVLPGFYEQCMALLEQHPGAAQCFSYPSLMDAQGRVQEMKEGFHWSDVPCYLSPDQLTGLLQGRHACGHCTILRRQALLEAGGFPPELRWHSDWFSELVMAFRHGICFIPKTFALQRMTAGTYSEKGRNHWPSQREALLGIFRRLKSPAFRDVLPRFQASHAMLHQGPDTVRALLSSPADWDLDAFKLVRLTFAQVLANDELMARFFPAAELEAFGRKLAQPEKEAFLFEPDWREPLWVEVLLAYLEAFAPGEPVGLVLPLDPTREGHLSLAESQALVVEVVRRTGRETLPDVVFVEDPATLPEVMKDYSTHQAIPASSGQPWALTGPNGARLNQARERLHAAT